MNRKLSALILFFFVLSLNNPRAQEFDQEQKQTETAKPVLVEEWQKNPEAFAELFFGEDLSKRTRGRGTSLKDAKKGMIEKVSGSYVEWPATFGIWQYWLNSPTGAQEQYTDNTSLYVPIGEAESGCIHIPLFAADVSDKKATWGIPPLSEVQLKMKLLAIKPGITESGSLDILVLRATEMEIRTTAKTCPWPEFSKEIYWSGNQFDSRIRIASDNDFPTKVGLRADDGGVDFIIPSKKTVSLLVPKRTYDIYFQFADDPESLYQGDPLNLEASGVEIRLKGKEGGDFKIRKIN